MHEAGGSAAASEGTRRLLDAVLDALPVGVVIADARGRIIMENAANRELWGAIPDTASWEEYGEWVGYWPGTGERIKADEWAMARALIRGEVVTNELVESERFGTRERRFFLNNAAPVRNAAGEVIAGVVVELDVTERLTTERALRQTEERYKLAVRATNDAVWDWDLGTGDVVWNEAVATCFGHADALSGSSGDWWLDHIHPDDRERVGNSIHEVIDGRSEAWRAEYRFRRADGRFAYVLDRGAVLRDEQGRALRMIGAMRDLTERKESEAALRASEAMFRDRLNAIPQMVWSTLPDGHHDFYNDRWYEFTGVEPGATDGEGWSGMFHPEDQPRAWEVWRRSLNTGEPYEIEYRLRHRSGAYRWVLGRALPIRNAGGDIVRWMGTCTDIDELKRTADELQRTSALLQLIGDSTPDMIYAKDLESRVIYANDAVRRVIGKAPEELLGRSDRDWAADPAEAEAIIANDRRVMDNSETIDLDEVFTGPDGVTRNFRSVKSPLRDATGATIGLVGVTSDVTARKRAEDRERLLAREVDHRAKNLLAVVQSVVQLTRADDIGSFTAAVVGRIHSLARAHSLLAASRWEGADLNDMVAEELAPFTGRDGRVHMDGAVVALKPDAAQALALVIHELATNAAKYGALSAETGRLEVTWALEPDERGRGQLTLVWREVGGPPVQPPSSRGFGSTVLRASVERQLKGAVQLDWRLEGLVCKLAIPADQIVAQGAPAVAKTPTPSPAQDEEADRTLGRRVLVLEDEALISLQVEDAVSAAGHEVIGPATRISEAIDLFYAEKPDAAVLDVMVAGERSFPLADVLRSKNVPFVFLTGFDAPTTLPERFKGAPVLNKPFTSAELGQVLRRL